jgi:hypothetical protein
MSPKLKLLAYALVGLFVKDVRADAALVLLDAVPMWARRCWPFKAVCRWVQRNWWGWPPEDVR